MSPLIGKRVSHSWRSDYDGRVTAVGGHKQGFRLLVMTTDGRLVDEDAAEYTVKHPNIEGSVG